MENKDKNSYFYTTELYKQTKVEGGRGWLQESVNLVRVGSL